MKIIGNLNVIPHYSAMLKVLNFFTLFIFIVFLTVAPYASAKTSVSEQTTEEYLSSQIFEEEIHHKSTTIIVIRASVVKISFPHFLVLKPQYVSIDFLKPPLS